MCARHRLRETTCRARCAWVRCTWSQHKPKRQTQHMVVKTQEIQGTDLAPCASPGLGSGGPGLGGGGCRNQGRAGETPPWPRNLHGEVLYRLVYKTHGSQDLVLFSGTKVNLKYSKFILMYKTHPFFRCSILGQKSASYTRDGTVSVVLCCGVQVGKFYLPEHAKN